MNKLKKILTVFNLVLLTQISFGQCQYLDTLGIANLEDSLATYFPEICKKITIGTSVSGHDIVALKFSDNVNTDEPEPEILLSAGIHGDENDPDQVMMGLARQLCLKYNDDPTITNLVDSREIWILPLINPDGLRGINLLHRPNANGVDLNRNFGYMWNAEDFDLFGYSEPETKAVRDFILSRNFNLMVDYHSGLQGIIYPWFYKTDHCPDFPEISFLANQYDIQSNYPTGEFAVTSGADLYVTNGSMVEFAYGSLGIQAFSVELQKFPPIWDACDLLDMNKPGIFMMIEKAGEGITGIVSDQITGLPIQAKIRVQERIPTYSSQKNGDYHHFLEAGTYDVMVSANGYSSAMETVVVSTGAVTQLDFQLNPSNNYAAQKILSCRNFNNPNDPAKTWNALGENDGEYYAIGDTGYAVLDMGAVVIDFAGNDITIYGDASEAGNEYELFYSHSLDGPWTSLGFGSTTTSYDLAGINNARFFRVEDNGIGAGNVEGSGFHLDALTATNLAVDVSEVLAKENNINLYPNPTEGIVHFSGDNLLDIKEVSIFNHVGSLLLHGNFTSKVDLTDFASGIYFIQLHKEDSIITFKTIRK